jgi:oligopeptide transport system ATP-binding protein
MRGGVAHAVRGVSLCLEKGEILGVVGESGSGKTVLAHSILRLLPQPPARIEGNVLFEEMDLLKCSAADLRSVRGNRICTIFQEPSTSFNPYMRLSRQLTESLRLHRKMTEKEALSVATAALAETGIPDPSHRIHAFPHEFSGGMLQRAMIAMALMMRPAIVFADEPTTALDVTVQAQLLNLMQTLRDKYRMSLLFITHNLGIVAGFCDRVMVMYAGQIMESATVERLFTATAHPYTRALIKSVPQLETSTGRLFSIPGTPPDVMNGNEGCPFYPRCEFKREACLSEPVEPGVIDEGHRSACIRIRKGERLW